MNNTNHQFLNTSFYNQENQPQTHNTLTFSEAWENIFHCKVSKDKLYSEVRAGRIPHLRVGTKILFRRDSLNAWMQQQEINSLR
ncbi:helix-turn-helix domain-containing protein [Paenibacillus sp. MCAF9]|uniref:helix-turn-helix domain-containing protein n=1 Tax=Paenibacillus sp. MCAF9 TaxID=3233046 RepID=UPI003F9D42BC